jgi:hypothetical protein
VNAAATENVDGEIIGSGCFGIRAAVGTFCAALLRMRVDECHCPGMTYDGNRISILLRTPWERKAQIFLCARILKQQRRTLRAGQTVRCLLEETRHDRKRMRVTGDRVESGRIDEVYRIVERVGVEVCVAAAKAKGLCICLPAT